MVTLHPLMLSEHHWEDLLDEKSPYNDYPAVNIGTLKQPEWFPSEKLTVLPYQVTRNPSTNEDLHNEMRNFAVRMNSEYMGLISHFMTNHMGRSAGSDSLLVSCLAKSTHSRVLKSTYRSPDSSSRHLWFAVMLGFSRLLRFLTMYSPVKLRLSRTAAGNCPVDA